MNNILAYETGNGIDHLNYTCSMLYMSPRNVRVDNRVTVANAARVLIKGVFIGHYILDFRLLVVRPFPFYFSFYS